MYVQVLGAFDLKLDEILVEAGKSELIRAATTKATGCILHGCASGVVASQLRSLVQRQVKQMRSAGCKESRHLHPLVPQKVHAVPAMRS